MKLIKAVFLTPALFSTFALNSFANPDFIGTYGISKNHPVKFELKINADKTFTYQDYSDPKNKIDAQGTWKLKDNKIYLQDQSTSFPFRAKWKIEKGGKAVKTRRGWEFIRIAKL